MNAITLKFYWLAVVTALSVIGCSTNDSDDKAKAANDKRIDQQAVAAGDDQKDEAKDTADNLVELASMGQTEFELSQLAVNQATNPEVRTYARRAMQEHQQTEKQLRDLARQLNVILPAELSKEGRERLYDLREKKPGTAFDIAYLKEMASMNDKARNVADDLEDDGPTDAVRNFARDLLKTDRQHEAQAKSLRNVLE